MPLQSLLEAGRVRPRLLRASREGRVEGFDHGIHKGFLLTGSKAYVSRWASEIIGRLDADPKTSVVDDALGRRGTYNLVLLHPKGGAARLAILPRPADRQEVELDGMKVAVGSFGLAGRFVMSRPDVPPGFFEQIQAKVPETTLAPAALSWLPALLRLPESTALALRAA